MKAKYEESENLSNEELLEELAEYDPEFTEEKKEELSEHEEAIREDDELGSPHKDEFEKDGYRVRREIEEKLSERNLDLLREKGEGRLADEFQNRMEKLDEDGKREWRERKEAEEKGEMHIGPERSIGTRKRALEQEIVDALYGLTPDEKTIIMEDAQEVNEFVEGKPYLDERREQLLDEHSYEENEERLDKSEMDWEKKKGLKARNRRKYGK